MAKKIYLETRSEAAFYTLIGISCHYKDYRLSFLLNHYLDFNLSRLDDLSVLSAGRKEPADFSFYFYKDEDQRNTFFLVSNRSLEYVLVPETKQLDFLLIIEGEFNRNRKDAVLKSIRSIPSVLAAYELKLSEIKNYETLLTDIELHMMNVIKTSRNTFKTPLKI